MQQKLLFNGNNPCIADKEIRREKINSEYEVECLPKDN